MIHYLDLAAWCPIAIPVAEVMGDAIAGSGGAYLVWRLCRELVASGHSPVSVTRFALVFLAIAAPAAWLGHRMGALVHLPSEQWRWDVFFEAPVLDATHGFHASLLLPFALLSALTRIWGYRSLQVMDAAFLFVPIAHAISGVGCLLVGCCWGETVRLGIPGFQATVVNVTPLTSIGMNLLIFSLLRKIFLVTCQSAETRRRYEGTVFGGYLALYGASRLVMEAFRHQDLVLWRLGHAELAMLAFLASGSWILWLVHSRSRAGFLDRDVDEDARLAMTRLTSILGIATSYLVLVFVFYYLTRRTHVLPTPFDRADSIGDAYTRLLFCVPLLVPALAALFFFERAGESVRPFLRWPRAWCPAFGVALAVSAGYAILMLVLRGSAMTGWAWWPPVLILSIVNAASEELIHRLAVLRLLVLSGASEWASLGIQAALYSLVHFMISPSFGVASLLYGLLLGVVMSRTKSLAACILCHFVIDLGGIGAPLLGR